MQIDIGISAPDRQTLASELSRLLADTYSLYLTTHSYHWNVTGPMFSTLHLLFEEQYRELWAALDTIAERIRALGHMVPAGSRAFGELSSIPDLDGAPSARDMIARLVEGHEAVIRTARGIGATAQQVHDEASVDLLTERLESHEKAAWMLRTMLEE